MTNVYAFVDSIGASPTVLLNLDDQNPLSVEEGMKTAPPTRRTSSYGSSARDGDVIAQESYNDRSITIPLSFKQGSTAEQQATTIQALGRLLDGPQWLKWQHDGATAPVFFRTRYGDIDIDDQIGTPTPTRYATLTLVAEPFAYGLPETGPATIANDPTAGTNPMSLVFPTVKGDVASPLQLSWPLATGLFRRQVIASMALPSVASFPIYTSAGTPTTVSGWTVTTVADAAWIGGSKTRAVYASGVSIERVFTYTFAAPAGDYRVMLRAKPGPGVTATIRGEGNPESVLLSKVIVPEGAGGATWYDLGVTRLPAGAASDVDPFNIIPATSAKVYLDLTATTAGTTDLDGLLFVPVGVDTAASSTYAVLKSFTPGTSGVQYLDGISDQAYTTGITHSEQFEGGAPVVVPGFANVLHFMASIEGATVGFSTDSISTTTAVTWTYFPRYLYVRPATT